MMAGDIFTWWLLIALVLFCGVGVLMLLHFWIEIGKWNNGRCKKCGHPWWYCGVTEDGRYRYMDFHEHEIVINPDAFTDDQLR